MPAPPPPPAAPNSLPRRGDPRPVPMSGAEAPDGSEFPARPLLSARCVTPGERLHLSEPQFPHRSRRNKNSAHLFGFPEA